MTFPVAEAVPVAPAAGYTVVALGALIAFVVSWGLAHSWGATFGPFLRWLGNLGISAGRGVFKINVHPFRFALKLDHSVQAWLSQAMALSERAMVHSFTEAYKWATLTVTAPFHLGEATYSALARLFHAAKVGTPTFIRDTIVRPLDKATRATIATLKANVGHLTHRVDALAAKVAHLTHAVPANVATLPSRVGYTSKQLRRLLRRLSALEKATVGLGAAAVTLAALKRLGLGWVRCAKVNKVGRAVCGMSPRWFDDVLGLMTDFLVLENMCRVIPLMEEGFEHVAAPLIGELASAGAGLCNKGYAPGKPLGVPALHLPAVDGTLSLPGV